MSLCKHHLICIRRLQSIFCDIERTIKILGGQGRAKSLSWWALSPCHPLASWLNGNLAFASMSIALYSYMEPLNSHDTQASESGVIETLGALRNTVRMGSCLNAPFK